MKDKAYVYRNLNKGGFSIMKKSKVVKVTPTLIMVDVEFRVRPAGSKKAKRLLERNVHAFAIGTVVTDLPRVVEMMRLTGWTPVRYHPFDHDSFINGHTGEKITGAALAVFINNKMWVHNERKN